MRGAYAPVELGRRLLGHRRGLVHVSEPADRSVWDPHEVVKAGVVVKVRVKEVDVARKRIGRTPASGNDRASGQRFGPRTSAQPSATRL